jgi:hypothetical protein
MTEPPSPSAGDLTIEAIVLLAHERELWDAVAAILEEPVSVVYRLCALSGAEHYLAELGRVEQAAMAGALLRMYAESKGIEVEAHEPSTREIHVRAKKTRTKTEPPR